MAESDFGIVIGEDGTDALRGDKKNLIFDSRDNTPSFLDREGYGDGKVVDIKQGAMMPHSLGFPPFVMSWEYKDFTNAPHDLTVTRFLMEEFEGILVNQDHIYISYLPKSIATFYEPTHILIGTDNLESPADKTVYID